MTNTLTSTFADLGLSEKRCQLLADIGFESPTQIQTEAIPLLLSGRDMLAQSQTGTGKTAAFALPLMDRIDPEGDLQALILTPTR
ncbi:DEAD/DEAH box helicase, partial [Synechocystis sp. LEGE 06083]